MTLDYKNIIGKIIKEYRKKHKLTQFELAEKVGLSEKHLGQIERGVFLPNLFNFLSIVNLLKIDLSELGLTISGDIDSNKEELLNIIYSARPKELKIYAAVLKTLKEQISNYDKNLF